MRFLKHIVVVVGIATTFACGANNNLGLFGQGNPVTGGNDPLPGEEVNINNPIDDGGVIIPPGGDGSDPFVDPTATPTASPTATPTASPTATPTASPTATPTPSPTPTVTPTPSHSTQVFNQVLAQNGVDILWVIDDSGSMDEEQSGIAANAAAFVSKLNAMDNFRLALITTDASNDNKLKNLCKGTTNLPYLTKATSNLFASCAQVGTGGSGQEEGIEAAVRALSPNYKTDIAGPHPLNPNFLRSEANLEIIFVSDEEDQSDIGKGGVSGFNPDSGWVGALSSDDLTLIRGSMASNLADGGRVPDGDELHAPFLSNHLAFFTGLKGGLDKLKIHAINLPNIDGGDACHSRTNSEEAAQRYKWMAEQTSGSFSDLCGDWATTMDQLGLQATGLKKCFMLDQDPIAASITASVMLNGNPQPSSFVFTAPNQVCFDTIPPANSVITISYDY